MHSWCRPKVGHFMSTRSSDGRLLKRVDIAATQAQWGHKRMTRTRAAKKFQVKTRRNGWENQKRSSEKIEKKVFRFAKTRPRSTSTWWLKCAGKVSAKSERSLSVLLAKSWLTRYVLAAENWAEIERISNLDGLHWIPPPPPPPLFFFLIHRTQLFPVFNFPVPPVDICDVTAKSLWLKWMLWFLFW